MNNQEFFTKNKYAIAKKMIPLDLCRVITRYALLKEETEFSPDLGPRAQVENAHAVYSDTLMETMMYFIKPHMESNTGLSLCPTYTYYRVYRPGMKLDVHRDRPSCEISTTICFGFDYKSTDPNYRWGMSVEPGILINQEPGDAIIYRGCEVDHWRDVFKVGPGSYQVQAFFHYIDTNGPFYPEYAYDRRAGLGIRNDQLKHINN
jgi:hypothetical protein